LRRYGSGCAPTRSASNTRSSFASCDRWFQASWPPCTRARAGPGATRAVGARCRQPCGARHRDRAHPAAGDRDVQPARRAAESARAAARGGPVDRHRGAPRDRSTGERAPEAPAGRRTSPAAPGARSRRLAVGRCVGSIRFPPRSAPMSAASVSARWRSGGAPCGGSHPVPRDRPGRSSGISSPGSTRAPAGRSAGSARSARWSTRSRR
jgi:hypothetical protein